MKITANMKCPAVREYIHKYSKVAPQFVDVTREEYLDFLDKYQGRLIKQPVIANGCYGGSWYDPEMIDVSLIVAEGFHCDDKSSYLNDDVEDRYRILKNYKQYMDEIRRLVEQGLAPYKPLYNI